MWVKWNEWNSQCLIRDHLCPLHIEWEGVEPAGWENVPSLSVQSCAWSPAHTTWPPCWVSSSLVLQPSGSWPDTCPAAFVGRSSVLAVMKMMMTNRGLVHSSCSDPAVRWRQSAPRPPASAPPAPAGQWAASLIGVQCCARSPSP